MRKWLAIHAVGLALAFMTMTGLADQPASAPASSGRITGRVVSDAPALAPAPAADAQGSPQQPLATKQQIVHDRMAQLEDRMFRLSEQLAQAEPQQAERLAKALKKARELLISRGMEEVVTLLDRGETSGASDRQVAITKDLEVILKLLLEDPENKKDRDREIQRLEQFRKDVNELLHRERELKAKADAAPRLARMLAGIRAAIQRLESIIGQQEQLAANTASAAQSNPPDAAPKLAQQQKGVRGQAESLHEELADPAKSAGGESPPKADGEKPAQQPPGGKPDGKPGEPSSGRKPAGAPGATSKPASEGEAGKPDKHEKDEAKKGDEHGDHEAHEGAKGSEPAESKIEAGVQKARDDISQAGGQMKSAENELGKGVPKEAGTPQKEAIKSLQRALRQLKQQEDQTHKLLDQAEAAKQQRELKQQAKQLAEKMKGSPQEGGDQEQGAQDQPKKDSDSQKGGEKGKKGNQQSGQQGEQKSGKQSGKSGQQPQQPPAPGQQNVEQSEKHMEDAAEDLDKEKPADASKDQQKAITELEQAQRELEQVLEQLRREQQEEILRGLESRFRGMLARQQAINKSTTDLDTKGQPAWTHADDLSLAGMVQDEVKLGDEAGEALHILKEDATTIVFPRIVAQLQSDMNEAAGRLRDKSTGSGTQAIEAEIVATLEELIDAIKEMRQQLQSGESGGGSPPPPGQNNPLLPDSAELKLLRSLQTRVNKTTAQFFEGHGDPAQRTEEQTRDLGRIAERQKEVAEMARKMHERQSGQ